jgi:hypothetical protein
MKERPILFSGPMVKAILDGRKTQTRRVVFKDDCQECHQPWWCAGTHWQNGDELLHCPYGQGGDRLWVRETFCVGYEYEPDKFTAMPFDGCENTRKAFYRATDDDANGEPKRPWKPSIHMPRWASRITLEIVSVRVERLQNIGEADAIAEGIDEWEEMFRCGPDSDPCWTRDARLAYAWLWNSINAKRGFGWDVNPWVWVIEFKVVTQ